MSFLDIFTRKMEYRSDDIDYAYVATTTLIRFCDDHHIPYPEALQQCARLLKKRDASAAYQQAIRVRLSGMGSLTDSPPVAAYPHESAEYLHVEIRALSSHWARTLSQWASTDA